jgi:pseudaminic acid biosynthesis-associated methylase
VVVTALFQAIFWENHYKSKENSVIQTITEQEEFWAGEFGDYYIARNQSEALKASNLVFFSRVLRHTRSIDSVIEFGANIGLNLLALKQLLPQASFSAIEINKKAVDVLRQYADIEVYAESILNLKAIQKYNFVLTKGVLIHIHPDKLSQVYSSLYEASDRYICIAEYYNPNPLEVNYRGHQGKLFKRDFAGEMLDTFKDLKLLDYGFTYHRDNQFAQDDMTWFLLEKISS